MKLICVGTPSFYPTPALTCSQHPRLVTHRMRASNLAPEFSRQPSSHDGLTQPVAKEELRPRGQAHDITRAAVKSGPCLHACVTGSSRPWDLGVGWTPCLVAQAPPGRRADGKFPHTPVEGQAPAPSLLAAKLPGSELPTTGVWRPAQPQSARESEPGAGRAWRARWHSLHDWPPSCTSLSPTEGRDAQLSTSHGASGQLDGPARTCGHHLLAGKLFPSVPVPR